MMISKTLYSQAIQCPKILWLQKYKPEVLSSSQTNSQYKSAVYNMIEGLACKLFPCGEKVPCDKNSDKAVSMTKQWIEEGVKTIYEATFYFDDILTFIDILHVNDDNSLSIYEVKSTTEVFKMHLHDVSLQYYVLHALGYKIKDAFVIHLNKAYEHSDEFDVQKLFSIAKVTEDVKALQAKVASNLKTYRVYLADEEREPHIEMGRYCNKPAKCAAKEYCWGH